MAKGKGKPKMKAAAMPGKKGMTSGAPAGMAQAMNKGKPGGKPKGGRY
jgi:hypothetical protein